MRVSVENEQRSKIALQQAKKKLECDINDLELALDMANKINVEAQKSIKKSMAQIQELQLQVEEEQRRREEMRYSLGHILKLGTFLLQGKLFVDREEVERCNF
jgi:predicted  nucleic acid-binding Zn-ribbon protein